MDIKEETSTVIFHSHQLSISEVSIQASGATHEAVGLDFDLKAQTVTFRFPAKLPVGSAKLRAAFTGTLNDDMAGFYRSKYTLRGESRWAAVTQFEATDARRCFPCIDEPAVKAVYAITVTAPADRTVISNMHAIRVSTSADGKQRTHEFADTPVMSTYLAAVFVGDFDCLSTVTSPSRIPTSIYTPVGQTAQGTFALKVASEGIEYLQKLFGVPFMGTKCDHIAIASFAAGAMENMGAISYREAALLIDEANSSLAQKQRVAQVVSHELSHLWFGDLSTMRWWDGLWLNVSVVVLIASWLLAISPTVLCVPYAVAMFAGGFRQAYGVPGDLQPVPGVGCVGILHRQRAELCVQLGLHGHHAPRGGGGANSRANQ